MSAQWLILALLGGPVSAAEVVGHWKVTGKPGDAPEKSITAGAIPKTSGGKLAISAQVPAAFVYDPLTGKSAPCAGSIELTADDANRAWLEVAKIALAKGESFTLEAFVAPDDDPRRTTVAVALPRAGTGTEFVLGSRWLNQFKQSYWGGTVAEPGKPPREWSAGHYVTIARLHKETLGWRHLALVYDAPKKTVACYVDHWLTASQAFEGQLVREEGPLTIGALPDGQGFAGKIADVRLTRGAIAPGQFLRAVPQAIENVDFTARESLLPRDAKYIDVREGFGARGDGVSDDTEAFRRAFAVLPNKVPGAYSTLFVPPGTYVISEPLHFGRFFVLQGAGRERTILKLKDGAKPFADEKSPQLEPRSPGTLVFKHATPERYTTTAGCGKLFLEDIAGTDWHFDHPQQIWARQWNPESHEAGPCIESKGATLWSLGFKTEYQSSKLWASAGARTEILGGFIYPVNKDIPKDRPAFRNEDSSMSLIYAMSVYVAGHELQVLDIRKGEKIETRMKDLLRLGARFRMDLYHSGEQPNR